MPIITLDSNIKNIGKDLQACQVDFNFDFDTSCSDTTHMTLPLSHLELYCAVLSGGTFPRLR